MLRALHAASELGPASLATKSLPGNAKDLTSNNFAFENIASRLQALHHQKTPSTFITRKLQAHSSTVHHKAPLPKHSTKRLAQLSHQA
jgi:hypothetical protein